MPEMRLLPQGLDRASIAAAPPPFHREWSYSAIAGSMGEPDGGDTTMRDRSVSAGQLSTPRQSPGGAQLPHTRAAPSVHSSPQQPRLPSGDTIPFDPFTASGPVMCISEYLSPASDKRKAAAARENALPTPGGPAEDGSEFDPFGVFMAVQAAKNTAMPGMSGTPPPEGPASPDAAVPFTPKAALGIEQGEEQPDELPVSIHVPRPRSTHGSDDWDDMFGRPDAADGRGSSRGAPVAVLFGDNEDSAPVSADGGETTAAGPAVSLPGSQWEAAKRARARRRADDGPLPADTRFGSAAEAIAAMPKLEFMLPRGS
mmetsp:Transcript_8524/g.21840  ORF Transcript_8524/g.21840 Transcript_8524/m.21840 type:complete len:314 (-) Transcript_8524:114-1055(-)